MPDTSPSALAQSIMGKLYDVLTNGDDTVAKSEDNFFSWETPGVPVSPDDFQFLTQGFTGVVKRAAVQTLQDATGTGAAAGTPPPALTEAQLNQLRAQDVSGLFQQAENFSRLVDFIPDVTTINKTQFAQKSVKNDEGTLSEVYERTLKMSQVMANELDDDTKKKIERFRGLLTATTEKTDLITGDKIQVTGPSPLVQAYNEKMAAYDSAALEYNNRRIDAQAADDPRAVSAFAMNAPILRDKVRAAMADWVSNGYKNDYEEIASYIAQVTNRDLTLLKQSYYDDLEKARLTGIASGSDFFYTALTPGDFATSLGWSKFHFASGDFTQYANSKFDKSGWEAKAGGGFLGIWGASAGAGASSSHAEFSSSFNSDHFSLQFEICQVPIVRPWFKSSFLNSATWRFDVNNPDLKDDMLSDGGVPPKGLMPAYPTTVVFVRNLVLDFGQNQGFSSWLSDQSSSHQGGGGSVGFGPFSISASGSHWSSSGSTSSSSGYSWTDQGLSVPGMQIVGYKCHVLPKSPHPSPNIKNWV